MPGSVKNSDSMDSHINNIITQDLEKNKLTLINEKIIKTLSLENKEKLIVAEVNKIIKKKNVGFFYFDEFLKQIHNKYKVKDDPKKYLITLYKEGVIIPYKREHDLTFNTTNQLLDSSEVPIKDDTGIDEEDSEYETETESMYDDSIETLLKEDIPSKQNLSEEKTLVQIPEAHQKENIVPKSIQKPKSTQTEITLDPKTISALGVKIDADGLLKNIKEPVESSTEVKRPQEPIISEIENRPEELLIRRKELLEKIQRNLNTFNFLDAMADLEIVIDICKKLNDDKAAEMYKKQSESILKTGLKYESVIDKVRSDPRFREELKTSVKDTLKEIRSYWQKKDFKNVYSSLKKVATLSYYLEDIDSAIRYGEQAELMKEKM